jgi:ubiquinone/menaquinone biosynthesis C-methylase UbiE
MFREIGGVRNEVDETSQILALFRDSISEIFLNESESIPEYFKPEYSHYLVVHTPLKYKGPENRTEWNLRFCRDVGVSVVELFTVKTGIAYVKGLMAVNGSKIYAILPYTSIDAEKAEKASFPEDRMSRVRARVLPAVLGEITGETILDIGSGFGTLTLEIAKNNPDSKVYGVDIHNSHTGQAQMNAEIFGMPNAEFRTGSACALPFENNSVDATTCFYMLHHLEDINSTLFEIKRVLKKGGSLTVVEPLEHQYHHGPHLSEIEWKELFEKAGFYVETQSFEEAVAIIAKK